jgi:ABC-type lipoprotein release transport system permease subunit
MDVAEIVTLIGAVGALIGTITGLLIALKAKSSLAEIHVLTNSTHKEAITRNTQLENTIVDAGIPLPTTLPPVDNQ